MRLIRALGLRRPVFWACRDAGAGAWEVGHDPPTESEVLSARDKRIGVFFTVNEMGDVRTGKGNLRWGGNAERPTACFIDFDERTKEEQAETIRSFELKPSAIVESGSGYHAYWFLEGSVRGDFPLWSRIQTELAVTFGGDTACSDPPRLLRMPGTWHVKRDPFMVRIVSLTDARYPLDALELFCPPKPEPKREYAGRTGTGRGYVLPSVRLVPNTRHATLKREAARLFSRATAADFEALADDLKAWYAVSCDPLKQEWEREVGDVVAWFRTRHVK